MICTQLYGFKYQVIIIIIIIIIIQKAPSKGTAPKIYKNLPTDAKLNCFE